MPSSVFQDLTASLSFSSSSSDVTTISTGLEGVELFNGQLFVSTSSGAFDQTAELVFYSHPDLLDEHIVYLAQVPLVYNSLAAQVFHGANSLSLVSALDIVNYDLVKIIDNTNSEFVRVQNVAGNTLNLVDTLVSDHNSSIPIAKVVEFGGFGIRDISSGNSIYVKVKFSAPVTVGLTLNLSCTPASGVATVNGLTGSVVLTTDQVNEGTINQYYTDLKARSAISAADPLEYTALTGRLNFATESANTILAGPTSGAASDPTFRTLVGNDLPSMSTTTSGAVPPTGTPTGKFLRDDGTFATATTVYTGSNSVQISGTSVSLINDSASPGNNYGYGTSSSGTKGFIPTLNAAATQTTVNGTTGSMKCSQVSTGSSYKKVVVYLSNLTGTSLVYNFPTSFVNTPYAYGDKSSSAIVTTSRITVTATGATGWIFIEGY